MRLTSKLINGLKHLGGHISYNSNRVIPVAILIVFSALVFKIFDDSDCFYYYEDQHNEDNDKVVGLRDILPYVNLKKEGCPNGWEKCFEYFPKKSSNEEEDNHLPIRELPKFMKQCKDCNEIYLDIRW